MKRLFYLLMGSLLLWQCNPDDNPNVVVVMEYPNEIFEIPAGLDPFESHYFIFNDVQTNSNFFLQSVEQNQLAAITPGYARIRSLEGGTVRYDFIGEIVIRMCSEPVNSGDEVVQKCQRELFYRFPVPERAENVLNLIPNPNVNVKELMLQDRFSFVVVLRRLRGTSPQFIETRVEMGLEAKR